MLKDDYGYIYKTTNLVNGKIYIGQRKGKFSLSYFGSGLIIKRALKKEGKEAFKREFIVYASNKEQLDFLERKFIKDYRELLGRVNLYNITDGGVGFRGKHTLVSRNKISQAMKGKISPLIGRREPLEQRIKIGNKLRGIKRSLEFKIKISKTLTGIKRSLETRIKMSKPRTLIARLNMCKPKTPEGAINIRIAQDKRRQKERLERNSKESLSLK
jgi:group I intron endonuclease